MMRRIGMIRMRGLESEVEWNWDNTSNCGVVVGRCQTRTMRFCSNSLASVNISYCICLIIQCAYLRAQLFPAPLTEAIVPFEGLISFTISLVNPSMLLSGVRCYLTVPASQHHSECPNAA